MIVTKILSVAGTLETDVYIVTIRGEIDLGTPEDFAYGLRPEDGSRNAMQVREAVSDFLASGGEVTTYAPPTDEQLREEMPPLSARQFRLGLITSGRVLEQVDEAIAVIEDAQDRAAAQIEWQYATSFRRLHPLVVNLSIHLGFTPEEVDALWMEAQEQ
ncbi:hypothetical protein [Roseibium algae]|uniref:Uncharacterized protein n=1 Tax=Roseibium algae TaxID=3123038 RepID=A0ABU8TKA2_9HYPH